MINYISTKGGIDPVGFDQAVLAGFADDGGLFVPDSIPRISHDKLAELSHLSYTDLAFELTSLFIDSALLPSKDLKTLIKKSFKTFEHPELMPLVPMKQDKNIVIMELFHGPTLSFKDIAMGFLINVMDYLLTKKNEHLNIVLATTGDTGPAAAFASAGKSTIDCWPLYPAEMISPKQERQMTTLHQDNIHPFSVTHCKDGGDDLDVVVAGLFSKPGIQKSLELSSVNSINWCRVMFQAVHYAYGYFRACSRIGEPIDFCVPSGAFGNLFAGFLAKSMGIPIRKFICANNRNQTLHRVISTGEFVKKDLIQTVSSAIDIVLPYNFWRFLYFISGCSAEKTKNWMDEFDKYGRICIDEKTLAAISSSFDSCAITDETTLATIKQTWENESYLLDPHGAVALAGARAVNDKTGISIKTICLATAHPAKFPKILQQALQLDHMDKLPHQAFHNTLTAAAKLHQDRTVCNLGQLEKNLTSAMQKTINN